MPEMTEAYECKGRELIGADEERIGKVDEIYVDDVTGRPEWATTARQKKDDLIGKAKLTTPQTVQEQVQRLASTAQQKPAHAAATGAFAGGLLIGWLLGRSRG